MRIVFGIWTCKSAGRRIGWRRSCNIFALCAALVGGMSHAEVGNPGASRSRARSAPASRVERLVCASYHHGMPGESVLALGNGALPVLANLLRDETKKHCWINATAAIGLLGDTTYFDTLRTFIWEQHRGQVDDETFRAILTAQGSVGRMASKSTRALDYMFNKTDVASWRSLPWSISSKSSGELALRLASVTVSYLSRVDHERLEEFARSLEARRGAGDRTATQIDSLTWHSIQEMNLQARVRNATPKSKTETK